MKMRSARDSRAAAGSSVNPSAEGALSKGKSRAAYHIFDLPSPILFQQTAKKTGLVPKFG